MKLSMIYIVIIAFIIISCGNISKNIDLSQKVDSGEIFQQNDIDYTQYYTEIYRADSLFITKNYKNSYKILDSLLQIYKPVNGWTVNVPREYLLSKSAVSKVKRKDVEDYLNEKAFDVDAIFQDKSIVKLLEEFKIGKNELEKIVLKNVSEINIPLRIELEKMSLRDQKVRNTKNYDSIKKIDSLHSNRLKEIIETVGFPNEKVVGGYRLQGKSSQIFLTTLFNHMAYNGDYNYFKKILPKLIKNGTCDPFNYAMLEDRENEITNRPIEYYVIITLPESVDRKKINANRKLIGLPSLEYEEFKKKVMSN